MNKVAKMLLNLAVLGALSGVILSGVFNMADPLIKLNKEKELKEAIFKVLPEAADYVTFEKEIKKGDELIVYVGLDKEKKPVGVAFKAEGNGFGSNVVIMVGLDLDYLKLKGIEVVEQVETPGLGDRIKEPSFKDQFKGVEVKPRVEYIKYRKPEKPNQIQAITGATISSNAVVTNINRAVERVVAAFPAKDLVRMAGEKAMEEKAPKEGTDGQ